jgi:hypothetical protein
VRTLTDDILALLKVGGHDVGDGTGEGLVPPFRVLYPLPQFRDGSLTDSWSDVDKMFQVTCEGVSRQQAEWLADLTDDQMIDADAVVEVMQRGEVVRDDTTGDPSRFKAFCRYRVRTYTTVEEPEDD